VRLEGGRCGAKAAPHKEKGSSFAKKTASALGY